jgi:hypothetical protein
LRGRRRRFCSDGCCRAGRRAERQTETADYVKFVRRSLDALAFRVGTADRDSLREMAELAREVDQLAVTAIAILRAKHNVTWQEIAAELGMKDRQGPAVVRTAPQSQRQGEVDE